MISHSELYKYIKLFILSEFPETKYSKPEGHRQKLLPKPSQINAIILRVQLVIKINLCRCSCSWVTGGCRWGWGAGLPHVSVQMLFPIWTFAQDGEGRETSCVGLGRGSHTWPESTSDVPYNYSLGSERRWSTNASPRQLMVNEGKVQSLSYSQLETDNKSFHVVSCLSAQHTKGCFKR